MTDKTKPISSTNPPESKGKRRAEEQKQETVPTVLPEDSEKAPLSKKSLDKHTKAKEIK